MKKFFIFIAALFLTDQASKFFFQEKTIEIVSFFSFHYAENTGIAFSLFQGYNWIFLLISILALILGVYFFHQYPLGLSFLTAGILGNLVDRLFFGFVRDFIAIGSFPIFNLADTWNTIGVFLLLYTFWKEESLIKFHGLRKENGKESHTSSIYRPKNTRRA